MRVLLIAYEYPPIVAAQALRWAYLTSELASLGVEVHVLCPAMPALPPFLGPVHSSVVEHRVWAGPFIGLGQVLAGRRALVSSGDGGAYSRWMFLGYRAVRFALDRVVYPDVRSEWYFFARRVLSRLLVKRQFDVIISSHEPAVDLLLGLWAKRSRKVPWVVDLADPVYAPYSPRWRRWLDKRVEGRVLRHADRVIVTTERLIPILQERHGMAISDKFVCIPQGAPLPRSAPREKKWGFPGKMNIVFTGNFYAAFRDPRALALALEAVGSEDIALIFAGDNARFSVLFAGLPNVRFLGRLGHFDCLDLQAEADVLLSIGNAQAYQIPGKVYEYLSAGRPILHLRSAVDDPCEEVLVESGLGRVVEDDVPAIVTALVELLREWKQGGVKVDASAAGACAARHGWTARVRTLLGVLGPLSSN